MALTNTFVDPSIAGNSGTGTIGDPYGDIQHALDTMTRDSTNGDRLNIKAGTDEILSATLSLATYGTPSSGAPLWFQGYTSAAEDGGIGGISGNATYSIFASSSLDHIGFFDMHLHNTGGNKIIFLDNNIWFVNCEIEGNTSNYGVDLDNTTLFYNCYVHSCGNSTNMINASSSCMFVGCYFENGSQTPARHIGIAGACFLSGNVFMCSGGTDAMKLVGTAINNTIYSDSGTGEGIQAQGNPVAIIGNVIEGFSGTGGIGISTASGSAAILKNNTVYNNATNFSLSGMTVADESSIVMGSSPFTNAATEDYTLVDDADVKASGYPNAWPHLTSLTGYLDRGAVQRIESAGGGGILIHPGMRGGLNG